MAAGVHVDAAAAADESERVARQSCLTDVWRSAVTAAGAAAAGGARKMPATLTGVLAESTEGGPRVGPS